MEAASNRNLLIHYTQKTTFMSLKLSLQRFGGLQICRCVDGQQMARAAYTTAVRFSCIPICTITVLVLVRPCWCHEIDAARSKVWKESLPLTPTHADRPHPTSLTLANANSPPFTAMENTRILIIESNAVAWELKTPMHAFHVMVVALDFEI
jgi:hypothetical protein